MTDVDSAGALRRPGGRAGEPDPPKVGYVVVEMAEGGRVDRTQVPEGVELLIVDHDEYLLGPGDRTRRDLEPYERCASCADVRMLHRGPRERSVVRGSGCEGFSPTGETPGGDPLGEIEGG